MYLNQHVEKIFLDLLIGISPDGAEYEFTNQLEFSKEHNLSNCLINECIHKTRNHHKGWTFKIKG